MGTIAFIWSLGLRIQRQGARMGRCWSAVWGVGWGFLVVVGAALGCARGARGETARGESPPLELTYLGTAGWRIDASGRVLLVDPYFSRIDVEGAKGAPLVPNLEAIARFAPQRADAILVGHSHYDHLLDVPDVAKRSGAMILGTPSTLDVGRAAGVAPSRLIDATSTGKDWSAGPWTVKAVAGLHSLIGMPSVPIPRDIALPMNADGYKEGGVLDYVVTALGRTVVFIGSANFMESELRGIRPDVAVVATGARDKVPDYTCRLLAVLGSPPIVVANHFDAFWAPLGPHQMDIGAEGHADLAKFADEVRRCSPATKVIVPKHFEPIAVPARTEAGPMASPGACFLLHETGAGEIRRSPADVCASRLSPYSTFKIPHALAALDSGVLAGKDATFRYDGAPVDFPSHRRDHTLVTAVHDSVVWYFQRAASMLGPERERAYLERLDYGNHDSSSGLTTFWLGGSLQISPEEQLRFMVRLYEDALPIDKGAMQAVRDILVQPSGKIVNATGEHPFAAPWPEGTVVSAKTGRGNDVTWLVGHVARGGRSWTFVSAVVGPSGARPLGATELAGQQLRSAGVL